MRLQPCGAECAITLLPPFREQLHLCHREDLELQTQLPAQGIDYFQLDQITSKYRPSPPHSWTRPLHIFQKKQSLNHPILLIDNTPSSRASRMLSSAKSWRIFRLSYTPRWSGHEISGLASARAGARANTPSADLALASRSRPSLRL